MPIALLCPKCQIPLTFGNDRAGTTFPCPRCCAPISVPTETPPPRVSPTLRPAKPNPHSLTDWAEVNDALTDADEEMDGTLTSQEENQIREALTKYARSIPHHDLPSLGSEVTTLTLVRELRTYSLTLRSLFEKRHAHREEEPWTGGSCPRPTIDERNIRVWDYDFPVPPKFSPATQSHRVNESQEVRICGRCNGLKWTICSRCSGSCGVTCSKCRGSGEEVCGRCHGGGYAPMYYQNGQVARVPCPCNTGYVRCGTCIGRGRVQCPTCWGKGQVTCRGCNGCGEVMSYLCVIQTFEPTTQKGATRFIGTEGDELEELTDLTDYKRFLVLNTTVPHASLNLVNGSQRVRDWITNAVAGARAEDTVENRLVRQKLVLWCASALEVRYEFGGKEYSAWFAGRQFRIHTKDNSITDVLLGMVAESVALWKEGNNEDSARQLREVMAMAKADKACRLAYEKVSDTIPAQLESKAKWFWWKPFIVAGFSAIVIILVFELILLAVKMTREKTTESHSVPTQTNRWKHSPAKE